MNATRLNFIQFKNIRTAGQIRRAVGLLKTEKKVMKLKIQFGEEIRFDEPIRRMIRTREQLWPGIRLLLVALAMAKRPKPITHRAD
jgi:hypothetical protein